MNVLVTGANGMVAREVASHCARKGDHVIALTREQLDITDREAVMRTLADAEFEVVYNCAAWTNVDECEANPALCFAVNACGVENLALACRTTNTCLVTISTDYVFDGAFDGFYTQRHDPAPQSEYARSKLHGENLARVTLARTIVVRTGWIFGRQGRNYLSRIPELLAGGAPVTVVTDMTGTPTYARHLAARLRELALADLPGIYHVVNSGGGTTYAGFARSVGIGGEINEIGSASLQRPAARPRNSRLRCVMSEAIGLEPLPEWRSALAEYVAEITS
jgi:dTDP-4-dehydrorhamnose reductase